MADKPLKCVEPARGPVVSPEPQSPSGGDAQIAVKEERMALARVGQEAPDFEANAFVGGDFKKVKLSDYRGQWVVMCFYPGDFTFV